MHDASLIYDRVRRDDIACFTMEEGHAGRTLSA